MFSATETAFTSVSKIKLKRAAEDGDKRAVKAIKLIENYDRLLTTILVGNNLVNILISSLCTSIFIAFAGDMGVLYATLFSLIVILAVGEITPKCLAKANPEGFALRMASLIGAIAVILTPVTIVFRAVSSAVTKIVTKGKEEAPTLTEDELMLMVEEIEGEGELEAVESELIKSAITFDDKTVSEIITPRVDVVGVERNASMDEVKDVLINTGYSRLPVYDGNIDKIVGVVYSKDFFARYFMPNRNDSIYGIIRRVKFIPESSTVAQALSEIQRSTVQMLVVVDDYGGTVGIVSLEDVLEELVGEIWDESDKVEYDIIKDADGSYTVLGDANINDLMNELCVKFDTDEYEGSTVGGFIQYKLNKSPIMGDRLTIDGITMIVSSVRNRRVKIVKVTYDGDSNSEDQSDSL